MLQKQELEVQLNDALLSKQTLSAQYEKCLCELVDTKCKLEDAIQQVQSELTNRDSALCVFKEQLTLCAKELIFDKTHDIFATFTDNTSSLHNLIDTLAAITRTVKIEQDSLRDLLCVKTQQVETLHTTLAALQTSLENLTSKHTQSCSELADVTHNYENSQKELNAINSQAQTLREEKENLLHQQEELCNCLSASQAKTSSFESSMKALESENGTLRAENKQISRQIETLRSTISASEAGNGTVHIENGVSAHSLVCLTLTGEKESSQPSESSITQIAVIAQHMQVSMPESKQENELFQDTCKVNVAEKLNISTEASSTTSPINFLFTDSCSAVTFEPTVWQAIQVC